VVQRSGLLTLALEPGHGVILELRVPLEKKRLPVELAATKMLVVELVDETLRQPIRSNFDQSPWKRTH